MENTRNAVIIAAVTAILSMPLALNASPARGDELADLRVNQELLQRRIDQLAQARVPGNPFGVGGPPGPVNVQMHGGSFPRSFLIPGTDTSIRVGGEIRMLSLYWITGGNPNGNSASTNAGTTGQLNNIPLIGYAAGIDRRILPAERSDGVLNMSPQQSKLSVETRTPTAWGEARSFLEFDFAGDTASQHKTAVNREQPAAPPALCLRHARPAAVRSGQLELQRFRRRHGKPRSLAV